jgi:hypothetical protein
MWALHEAGPIEGAADEWRDKLQTLERCIEDEGLWLIRLGVEDEYIIQRSGVGPVDLQRWTAAFEALEGHEETGI